MTNFICKLASLCWYRAWGTDAVSFLNGQFSNDLQALDNSHLQLNAYCNPKGRMLCIFEVRRSDDELLLQLPCELQETLINRLKRYVLRADVTLEPQPFENIGVVGRKAEATLAELFGELPNKEQQLVTGSGLAAVKRHAKDLPRYQIFGAGDAIQSLWHELSQKLPVTDESAWWHQSILAGVPRILDATTEAFIPQMVNLDLLNGISFTKGCYPGQEIVARMRYLGKLKQRMHRVHSKDKGSLPQPGDKISANQQNVGAIIDAQYDNEGSWDALAVLQLDLPDHIPLTLPNGTALSVRPLPYPLQTAEQKQG